MPMPVSETVNRNAVGTEESACGIMPCFDKELAQRQYSRMTAGCDAKRAAGVGARSSAMNLARR
jgi:hypothetical protein